MKIIREVHYPFSNALVLVLITFGITAAIPVHANDKVWYVGTSGLGKVTVDRNVSDFDDGSIISGRVDDKDSGWKLFGGYRITKHFFMEIGRADLNNDQDSETTFTGQSDGTGSRYAAGKVTVDNDEPIAYYLAAVGRLPLPLGPAPYDDRLALIGKVGMTSWEASQTTIDASGKIERNIDGTDVITGLALEYKWPNGFGIRSEWEFFKGIVDEDYEIHSAGITYDF